MLKNGTPEKPIKLLISAREAAAALSISARSLWSRTNTGEIPSIKIGRSVRYSPDDLKIWIEKQKGPAAGCNRDEPCIKQQHDQETKK